MTPKPSIKPLPANPNFPKLEEAVLRQWRKERTFAKSLAATRNKRRFTFYDGPPFATGRPHYGNLLQGLIKDIIPRFKTMQGFYVERRFGWDCHGLPVEYEVEKELGIKRRQDILKMGVGKFNNACRSIVLRYTRDWRTVTERIGRWVDMDNDYKTMDPDYMESIWWVVKTLWEKGLLYEGRKSMHICPRCATTLSNFEVTLNYQDRADPSAYVAFPLAEDPAVSLVIWTTTPWTLPGNVLVAVNKHLGYVEVEHRGSRYVVAEPRLADVFPDGQYRIRRKLRAEELIGKSYEPPFPKRSLTGTAYQVVASDAVTAEEGTGLLHVAPAFGEEDMAIGKREQAAFIQPIDITGRITKDVPRHRGKDALAANPDILADLKRAGRLVRSETISHSYPHCWRCETPLLNFAATEWFVAVTKLKQRLLEENEGINWVPDHLKHGRFGKWLEGARDWAISRNRFWGNPMPIWRCDNPDGSHLTVVGSRAELAKLSGKRPKDLHKQFVDKITFPCPECPGKATRVPDVLDCWFESGSMPYAVQHYPFEHKRQFEQNFPADFIGESVEMTRGWFYTLHVLSVALKDSPASTNIMATGTILAEDGKKMSKRLKNYPDPADLMARYGADAVRLYLMSSPVVKGENLNFSEPGVAELTRSFSSTLYNVYGFLATHADRPTSGRAPVPKHLLDRWILSRLASLVAATTEYFERYDLMAASRSLVEFLDELSNWYVRRSRKRIGGSAGEAEAKRAQATLYHVLTTYLKLAAPITPFLADHLYRSLTGESVHLATWPMVKKASVKTKIEEDMSLARRIVRLGLAARSRARAKVRQPLLEAQVVDRHKSGIEKNKEIVQLIADELNVKRVTFISRPGALVREVIQPVASEIGPLLGDRAQDAIEAIKRGNYRRHGQSIEVLGTTLPAQAVRVSYAPTGDFLVEATSDLVVGLSTELDAGLVDEGRARDLIRHFQELRKTAGLSVGDRIRAAVETTDPDLERVVDSHRQLIMDEIRAGSLEPGQVGGQHSATVKVDGKPATIGLAKVP
jgi:isoleucyl-tRNA synthetase